VKTFLVALAALLLLCAGVAMAAGSASNPLNVKAKVDANCKITTADLDFGSYDPVTAHASTDLAGTGGVSLVCTKGASSVTVGLGLGSNASGSNRNMSNGTDALHYELYQDAAHSTVWANSGAGLQTWAAFGSIASQGTGVSKTVYGVVFAGQDVSVGSYADSVTATVNF
jgi:spore coat protein U-like protein